MTLRSPAGRDSRADEARQKNRKLGELILLHQKIKKNARDESFDGAALSESVLGRDWNSPEEDAAWADL
jgi:hypothetical protein